MASPEQVDAEVDQARQLDRQYLAGLQQGWLMANAGATNDDYVKIIASRRRDIHDSLAPAPPIAFPLAEVAERMAKALEWYAKHTAGCRKLGSIGEPSRNALHRDGGAQAIAVLAAYREIVK